MKLEEEKTLLIDTNAIRRAFSRSKPKSEETGKELLNSILEKHQFGYVLSVEMCHQKDVVIAKETNLCDFKASERLLVRLFKPNDLS